MNVNIIHDSSKEYSIKETLVKQLKEICRNSTVRINKPIWRDMREPLTHVDINIHLEFPVYSVFPWAFCNLILKDMNSWKDSYNAYIPDCIAEYADINTTIFEEKFNSMVSLAISRKPSSHTYRCPPVLFPEDCPPISIVTPTYNRRKFLPIAFHNILLTDYPKDKIEWIVVEDNEKQEDMASELIIQFQMNTPAIKVKYIPLLGKCSIGHKRNIGVENATNDIILFMDDDDHYPVTSFRRRVAWLTRSGRENIKIVCCTSIAMYDLVSGKSAVNCPPYDLPLARRISEATFTFFKSAWDERKFTDDNLCEGEAWISGRENNVIELQPQQIIVAFNHSSNQSRRKIPDEAKVGCFWGFPKDFLKFIHGIAGVEIV